MTLLDELKIEYSSLKRIELAEGVNGMFTENIAPAPVFMFGECSSTFDLAWKLDSISELSPFSAVVALSQNSGRGQMRRNWHSPEGNLYASFFLPASEHFKDEAASVFTALLCLIAFSELGIAMNLKWPNDLVLPLERACQQEVFSGKFAKNTVGKVGGILLEEREGRLLAGLGVNCRHAPPADLLRANAAMPATVLPYINAEKSGLGLWLGLVQHLIMSYDNFFKAAGRSEIISLAEKYLLWLGQNVTVRDLALDSSREQFGIHADSVNDLQMIQGTMVGLSERGGLLIAVREGMKTLRHELFSGSVIPSDPAQSRQSVFEQDAPSRG